MNNKYNKNVNKQYISIKHTKLCWTCKINKVDKDSINKTRCVECRIKKKNSNIEITLSGLCRYCPKKKRLQITKGKKSCDKCRNNAKLRRRKYKEKLNNFVKNIETIETIEN